MPRFEHVARRWRRMRLDRAETLIEVLVTVAILGVSMVAITGGISTSIITSDIHHKQAVAGTVLVNFAEAVELAPYVTCPSARTTYVTATLIGATPPSGYTLAIVSTTANPFEYSNTSGTFASSCPVGGDGGLQRMWLQVSSNDGRDVETVQLVKRIP
jgi:type II secretory pathway pseudopilin PulG